MASCIMLDLYKGNFLARKVRIFIENISQHVLLKGLNDLVLFQEEADYIVEPLANSNILSS